MFLFILRDSVQFDKGILVCLVTNFSITITDSITARIVIIITSGVIITKSVVASYLYYSVSQIGNNIFIQYNIKI